MEMLFKKESEQILGFVFQVRNELGGGWSEEIYHQALVKCLEKHDIPFSSKPRQTLFHRDEVIHTFEPDIIVWDKIILELKVLPNFQSKTFPNENLAQTIHYLKFNKMRLGLLLNFAHPRVGIRRVIFDETKFEIEEEYERMLPHINESDKKLLRKVQKVIKDIGLSYGLGYPETLYKKLISIELKQKNISNSTDITIPAMFQSISIGTQKTQFILIDNRFLLNVKSSITGSRSYEFIKTRTYLRALGLKVGWVINFGQKALQINATSCYDKA